MTQFRLLPALALAALLAAGPPQAQAAGGGGATDAAQVDPEWVAAKEAIAKQKFQDAVPLLQQIVADDPNNADALNYLGYAHSRMNKNEQALDYYGRALALNPKHRGANEYLGELYLKLGNLKAAEERLEVLDAACFFGCAEYTLLKDAIAEYKATGRYTPHKGS